MAGFLESLFDPSILYDSLNEQNLLPQWHRGRPVTSASGSYYPDYNQLVAPDPKQGPYARNTASHEMTHAVQDNLLLSMLSYISEKKWQNKPITDQEEQYYKAVKKLMNVQPGRVGQYDRKEHEASNQSLEQLMGKLFHSTGNKDFDYYRTRPTEAQAFGVGGMSGGGPNDNYGYHLDPTMATELSMILSMYKQLPKNLRDEAATQRRSEIDKALLKPTNKESIRSYYDFDTNIKYKNPFIK